jgi:hypothetical protein
MYKGRVKVEGERIKVKSQREIIIISICCPEPFSLKLNHRNFPNLIPSPLTGEGVGGGE